MTNLEKMQLTEVVEVLQKVMMCTVQTGRNESALISNERLFGAPDVHFRLSRYKMDMIYGFIQKHTGKGSKRM
jgi:hypothetical protein